MALALIRPTLLENEAKVQREPKQMNHHEKPDTIFSIDGDEKVEEIKIHLLKARIQCAHCDIHSDNIVNGDNFFDELMEPNK